MFNAIPMYSNYHSMFYMNNINQINLCEPHLNVIQSKTANCMNGILIERKREIKQLHISITE